MPIRILPSEFKFGQIKFLRIDNGSEQMAINGLSTGDPEIVWNGTGVGDTGGDWTQEANGTETAYAMHSGTNGLDSGLRSKGQETRFSYGENISLSSYDTLSFWINPQAFPVGARLDIRWRTMGGATPGLKLNVGDYVSNFDLDVWQRVAIPLSDFELNDTDVGKLVFIYALQGGQQFYFDDIELVNGSADGPFTYRVASDGYGTYHVDSINLIIASGDAGWNSDSFGDIDGGLTSGLVLRQKRLSDGEVIWSTVIKNNMDLFGKFHMSNEFAFGDNELMVALTLKPSVANISVTDDEVLEFILQDNLSSLSNMRAYLQYGVEEIT